MRKAITTCLVLVCLLWKFQLCFGAWQGPTEIITGQWGAGETQFGFKSDDMGDAFPYYFFISNEGPIIVYDLINSRIKLYDSNGMLLKNIIPPVENPRSWAIRPILIESKILLLLDKIYYLSLNGDLVKKIDYPEQIQRINRWVIINSKIYLEQAKPYKCIVLSSDGQLIETYKERSLELGVVDTNKIKRKQYKITIKYPDKTYQFMAKRSRSRHFRDAYNNLYWVEKFLEKVNKEDIFSYRVFICNACDDNVFLFNMPQSQYEPRPPDSINYPTWTPVPIIEYGEPIVSPAGDIYCWARSKTEYKILKWTWQGEPDAPQSLKANSREKSLVLTWKKPVEDAATITGYEIHRSSDVCGPFNKIKKVKKGVMQYTDKKVEEGETYYYRVCAERGSGYSGYSNKAVGSIKD